MSSIKVCGINKFIKWLYRFKYKGLRSGELVDHGTGQTFNVFKYHVSCTDGKISVTIKIGIDFIFRSHRRPIQLVILVLVALSLPLQHCQQHCLLCSPAWPIDQNYRNQGNQLNGTTVNLKINVISILASYYL